LKIVLIGPVYPYRGGIAHYTTLIAKALLASKHEVKVISFKRQYPKWLYPGQDDHDPSREPITVDANFLLDPLYPWTWRKAIKQIIKDSPDLVLIQWWTTFWAFAYAPIAGALKRMGIRVGYLIHNVIPHEARLWDRFLAKMALGKGDIFVVQSSGQRETLQRLIPNARIELVEHPIYDMFAVQKIDKKSARRKLGLPEDLPLILFFGIVRPYKGLTLLVDALGQLFSEGFQAGLYIAGEFWEDVQKYQDQIKRLNLSDKVWIDNRYIPNEEVAIIFSAADVFVAPYISGTQSGAVKMALGFGLPVIASEIVASDQSFYHSTAAKVIDIADCNALKEALREWLSGNWKPQQSQPLQDGWESLVEKVVAFAHESPR